MTFFDEVMMCLRWVREGFQEGVVTMTYVYLPCMWCKLDTSWSQIAFTSAHTPKSDVFLPCVCCEKNQNGERGDARSQPAVQVVAARPASSRLIRS